MKNLLLAISVLALFSCKKQSPEPEPQQSLLSSQVATPCDTVMNCWFASAQGTYTFQPGNGEDTSYVGGAVRVTFDGVKDTIPVYHQGVFSHYNYNYWYKITPINFDKRVQTTIVSRNRVVCGKGNYLLNVSFYTKSGKRATFHKPA